jgi:F0F1-type ATP synthase beta subunit
MSQIAAVVNNPDKLKSLLTQRVKAFEQFTGINLSGETESVTKIYATLDKILEEQLGMTREEAAKVVNDAMNEKFENDRKSTFTMRKL